MTAAQRCAAAIRRIGGSCTLVRQEEEFSLVGSIQPLRTTQEPDASPLGFLDTSYYHFYVPMDAERPLCGDTVVFGDCRYHVRNSESIFFAGEPVYYRVVLRLESGEEPA